MGKKEHYKLPLDVIEHLIDPLFVKNIKNRGSIKSMIINIFTSVQMETLVSMLVRNKLYKEFHPNCYVLVEPKNYWAGDFYELDKMKDAGLLSDDGRIYGILKDDTSWDHDAFNPYYVSYKIDLLIVNENNELEPRLEEMNTSTLEMVDEKDIKYLKAKKNG